MRIPINCTILPSADDNLSTKPLIPTYLLIELNGQLLSPHPFTDKEGNKNNTRNSVSLKANGKSPISQSGSDSKSTELGMLTYREGSGNIPQIVIGTHEIKGKVVKLKKEILVLRKGGKRDIGVGSDGDEEKGGEGSAKKRRKTDGGVGGEEEVSPILIIGVIKEKLLFDTYPKTIMRAISGL